MSVHTNNSNAEQQVVSVWLDVQNAVTSRQKGHFLLIGKETGYREGFMEEITGEPRF